MLKRFLMNDKENQGVITSEIICDNWDEEVLVWLGLRGFSVTLIYRLPRRQTLHGFHQQKLSSLSIACDVTVPCTQCSMLRQIKDSSHTAIIQHWRMLRQGNLGRCSLSLCLWALHCGCPELYSVDSFQGGCEEFELTANALGAHIKSHGGLILRTLSYLTVNSQDDLHYELAARAGLTV